MTENNPDLLNSTIMMVDDEPINMEVVQAYLEEDGYSSFVLEEKSVQALTTLQNYQPDILLLDIVMPEMDGFEVLSEIRSNPHFERLPVIILTSSTDTESKIRALELGATDLLAKPVDASELKLRVRNTLAAKAFTDRLAYYDTVTGLPNRQMFDEQLSWAMENSRRFGGSMALLSVDIDELSRINAAMGQSAGDYTIREIGNRISWEIRQISQGSNPGDANPIIAKLFRTEGSMYSLILENVQSSDDAAEIAERLQQSLKVPVNLGETDVVFSLSIGGSLFPQESDTPEGLVRLSSSSKDYVKKNGGNGIQFSSPEINDLYAKRVSLENRLRKGLDNDEFVLHYQPKVSFSSGKIVGVEALLRWQDGDSLVPPFEFIPVAEETGLIIPIGQWVIEESYRQLATWHKLGFTSIGMNLNISPVQFQDPDLESVIRNAIVMAGVSPHFVTLEITETMLLEDIEEKLLLMQRLRDLGVRISIDDFGTGFSSLSYLTRLPADELKIDRSFVMNLPADEGGCAVVTAVLFLAKKLGMSTVAEGVETKEQLEFLRHKHCDTFQGFLFSRPLPADELYEKFFQPAFHSSAAVS